MTWSERVAERFSVLRRFRLCHLRRVGALSESAVGIRHDAFSEKLLHLPLSMNAALIITRAHLLMPKGAGLWVLQDSGLEPLKFSGHQWSIGIKIANKDAQDVFLVPDD